MNSYETLTTKSPLWETLPDTAAEKVTGGLVIEAGLVEVEFDYLKIVDGDFTLELEDFELTIKDLKISK